MWSNVMIHSKGIHELQISLLLSYGTKINIDVGHTSPMYLTSVKVFKQSVNEINKCLA